MKRHKFIARLGSSEQLDQEYDRIMKHETSSTVHNNFIKMAFSHENKHNVSANLVQRAWDSGEDDAMLAASHHPLFSKESHEKALVHPWSLIRTSAILSHHTTDEQLKKVMATDPVQYHRGLAQDLLKESSAKRADITKKWYDTP